MRPQNPLHIAVLLHPPIQLLDLSPIDLFAMLSVSYLTACSLPPSLIALGIPDSSLRITYVAPEGAGSLADTTAMLNLQATAGLTDSVVQPGNVDILLLPGPDPSAEIREDVRKFVKSHFDTGNTDILTVCTGVIIAAASGILENRTATGSRGIVDPILRKQYPGTKWRDDVRWWIEGRIWTSGGITNGQDMVAAYIRQRWPGSLSETVCAMADVGERGQYYTVGKTRDTAWWVWNIFRAWSVGLVGGGGKEKGKGRGKSV
ncbi:PfpI endopeptidase-like protein [Clohesyomyces aquaticus]|uniref:PfpI endopeptidase-like protein n=1 Tax=Clohesyomyces aquaticus TaxID=1231657 RepID=A0A1Y1Y7P4_9PLEO|nr:PfpI endopeptidase-like protein [Clohesyomyces aquaticus]